MSPPSCSLQLNGMVRREKVNEITCTTMGADFLTKRHAYMRTCEGVGAEENSTLISFWNWILGKLLKFKNEQSQNNQKFWNMLLSFCYLKLVPSGKVMCVIKWRMNMRLCAECKRSIAKTIYAGGIVAAQHFVAIQWWSHLDFFVQYSFRLVSDALTRGKIIIVPDDGYDLACVSDLI